VIVAPLLLSRGVHGVKVPEQNTIWLPVPHVGPVSRLVICAPLAELVNVIVKSSIGTLPFHVSKPRPTPGVPQLNDESWLIIQPSPGAIVPLAPEPLKGMTMVAPAIAADARITAKILPKKRRVTPTSVVAVSQLRMSRRFSSGAVYCCFCIYPVRGFATAYNVPNNYSVAESVSQASSGGFVVGALCTAVAFTNPNCNLNGAPTVLRVDSSGNIQSQTQYSYGNGPQSSALNILKATSDGGAIFAG